MDVVTLKQMCSDFDSVSLCNAHVMDLHKHSDNISHLISVAKENNRYLDFDDMSKPGFSENKFMDEILVGEYHRDVYIAWYQVSNFDDYKKLIMKFYNKEIPAVPDHDGPWNFETSLILPQLKSIVTTTPFVPSSSQPGMIMYNNPIEKHPYIQIPYVYVTSTISNIQKLLQTIYTHENFYRIKYVTNSLQQVHIDRLCINFRETMSYAVLGLCMDLPERFDDDFLYYIFTDKFFDDMYTAAKLCIS